jgi:hypothetical protein
MYNKKEQHVPQTPASVVRRYTRLSRPPERYSPSLYYLLLIDSGEPKCYEEARSYVRVFFPRRKPSFMREMYCGYVSL